MSMNSCKCSSGLIVAGLLAASALSCALAASGHPPSAAEMDRLASRAMKEFSVPGIAIGIVKDGRLVFAKGYGVRESGKPQAVNPDTLFAIGSNTKAFTTAALAMLVDAGKLRWDDRVIDYIPDFRMWDPYVTREFRIRDLLAHRSGLGTGAGDLMFVTKTDFTREDLLHGLRYLKPVSSFRSQFAYDNLLYVIAGQLIPAVAGQSWEDFVTARIFKPLHMEACAADETRITDRSNVASPHALVDGQITKVAPLAISLVAPAGAIQCNITGMAKWVSTQLAHGKSPDGLTIFSVERSAEMWSPQTILPTGGERQEATRTHFAAYALGWVLEDVDGYERVSHNGGVPGMVTHVGMIPELNLGVIVLTNQQEGQALDSVALQIIDAYAGAPQRDWIDLARASKAKRDQRLHAADVKSAPPLGTNWQPSDLNAYVGTFHDPWRGDAKISRQGDSLQLTFSHTDALTGSMAPVGLNLFIVKWQDRSLNADAYVRFSEDYSGQIAGFTMRAVSATTDFSFDFQDLDFSRAEGSH